MKLEAEVKWASLDEEGWSVDANAVADLTKAKLRWADIEARGDAASAEVCALVARHTMGYMTLSNLYDDDTVKAWFGDQTLSDLELDLDPLEGAEVTVSAVSFAEADRQADLGESCHLVPSIRASCVFELPGTKTRADIEAINANTALEPLHGLINFEVGLAWLGVAESVALYVHLNDGEVIELRG
jgi:hypothetical protein